MVRPLELEPLGGYFPFVNLPCERDLGEITTWIIALAALPLNCQLIPWLCCPLEIDPETVEGVAVSTDIDCSDPRAPIGGLIQWAMVAVSIAGFLLALIQLGECALVQYNVLDREIPTTIVFELEDDKVDSPLTLWFNNLEAALQQFQQDYLKYDTNFNADHKLTVDLSNNLQVNPLVLGGRFSDRLQQDRQNLTLRTGSTPGSTSKISALTGLAEFLKKQSIIHQETKKLNREAGRKSKDFQLIFKDGESAPVYADRESFVLTAEDGKTASKGIRRRVRRQAVLDVPIPVARPFYSGTDEQRDDDCGRNTVEMEEDDYDYEGRGQTNSYNEQDEDDDRCFEVLTRGPCQETEIVFINPLTKKGICGPRLCAPDRVFLFGDQKCHDLHSSSDICPKGRQLFSTGFGTPICGCEDGFYERETDGSSSYEDVCQPLLTEISSCEPGKVFWFKSFKDPPGCYADPCKGLNLNRKYSELPYVPALKDGNCYQIGTTPKICKSDEYYALHLPKLKGVCQTLEEAGYLTLDSSTLDTFSDIYGPSLPKEDPTPPPYRPKKKVHKIFPKPVYPLVIGQSVVGPRIPLPPTHQSFSPTHVTAHSPAYIAHSPATTSVISIGGNVTLNVFGGPQDPPPPKRSTAPSSSAFDSIFGKAAGPRWWNSLSSPRGDNKDRVKRSPQPHASPGNVFEPALSSCRAGAVRDVNQKCRNTILPSRVPHSRPRRAARPTRPFPSCPSGSIRSLQRRCTSSFSSVQSSIIARGLG